MIYRQNVFLGDVCLLTQGDIALLQQGKTICAGALRVALGRLPDPRDADVIVRQGADDAVIQQRHGTELARPIG